MKPITFSDLYDYNYSVEVLNALRQNWASTDYFSCIGSPKEKNMLLYLSDCRAEYTLKSGEKFYAQNGDIVFTPINYEYTVRFYELKPESYTIGVNFFIFDRNSTSFIPDRNICVFNIADSAIESYFSILEKTSCSAVSSPAIMKAALYEILTKISISLRNKRLMQQKYSVISEGIKYLETDETQSLSVKELADLCNVSEVYFRRLFTEYSGYSPIQYRLRNKIEKAKILLKYDNLTINEISDRLGFVSSAYFTKIFKASTGKTPSGFRK